MPIFASLSAIDKSFICQLCKTPWDPSNAIQCPQCEDVYCQPCVEEAVLKGKCCVNTTCNLPFDPSACTTVHRVVRSLADTQVPVLCKNHLRRCPWTGARSALAAHENECRFAAPLKPFFSSNVPDELLCQICHEVMTDPLMVAGCDHIFCGVCLQTALSSRQACPTCASSAASTEPAPKIINMQLENLPVLCANKDIGCTFNGTRRNYAGHIATCPFASGVAKSTTSTATAQHDATLTLTSEFPFAKANVPHVQKIATLIHLEAPELVNLEDRKQPLCISAAIDVSGSMAGEKIELVRQALEFMVDELTDRDSFGIVTFESNVVEVLPITRMTPDTKLKAKSLIKLLRDMGSTDLHSGVIMSIRQVTEYCKVLAAVDAAHREVTSNVVLLFTDGQANAGISDATQIVSSVKSMLQTAASLSVYTFGFGSDHNASLLQSLAEGTQGSYYYIKNAEVLKESFADCLGGLVSTVMSDIQVTLQLASTAIHLDKLMTKFPSVVSPDGSTITISIKDMYSTESRDIPVAVRMETAGVSVQDAWPLFNVSVKYLSAIDQQIHTVSQLATLRLCADAYEGPANMQVDEQRNRFVLAEAMEEAHKAAEQRRFGEAQAHLDAVQAYVATTVSHCSPQTSMVVNDALNAQRMMSESMYHKGGSQVCSAAISRHHVQRCNDASDDACYANAWKVEKKMKSKK